MTTNLGENRKSVSNADEDLKLLSLVDILEPLAREESSGFTDWPPTEASVGTSPVS